MNRSLENKFSVITCTYNPDLPRLKRVMKAVEEMGRGHAMEYLIVDNHSNPALANQFNESFAFYNIIPESKQGLAHARLTGVEHASGEWIVFMDDDNVPQIDYLNALQKIISENPQVGIWGPGEIEVEFEKEPELWVKKYFMSAFQQKKQISTEFGTSTEWPSYFPAGSGMCVRKDVFLDYALKWKNGAYAVTGRKGNTLSSGEDAQLIWNATKNGIPVGSSPLLKLTHLIPEKRTSLTYLKNLYFHLSQGYYQAKEQVFGWEAIENEKPRRFTYLKKWINCVVKTGFHFTHSQKVFQIEKEWLKGFPNHKPLQ